MTPAAGADPPLRSVFRSPTFRIDGAEGTDAAGTWHRSGALAMLAVAAQAAGVEVSCEKRSNRSKFPIDGNDLAAGSYRAAAESGTRKATSCADTAIGDEVGFDSTAMPPMSPKARPRFPPASSSKDVSRATASTPVAPV